MPTSAPPTRSKTAEEILDLAEALIQTRGYSAFSYQDIADALGIRKASIHYHFPSKTELGIAVVDRYAERFGAALEQIAADTKQSSIAMLDHYIAPYLELARTPDKVCLCGALAGEMMALPPELRTRVDHFFKEHQTWLAGILARGAERGEFCLAQKPTRMARLVFGALQGALLVKRTTSDSSQLKDVVAVLKSQLLRAADAA
jgi:TetR/AcrR family transcriptional regulator, transcriptional repressor for nem operon